MLPAMKRARANAKNAVKFIYIIHGSYLDLYRAADTELNLCRHVLYFFFLFFRGISFAEFNSLKKKKLNWVTSVKLVDKPFLITF